MADHPQSRQTASPTSSEVQRIVLNILVLLGLLSLAMAGDLEPSAPPAPTMTSLDKVEPRVCVMSLPGSQQAVHVISEPGNYYLTEDLVGEPGKQTIIAEARFAKHQNKPFVDIAFVVD